MNAKLQRAQAAYDARVPDLDTRDNEYMADQVDKLLRCQDADNIAFFSKRYGFTRTQGFAELMSERLSDIDNGPECFVLQCVLAVLRGDSELASAICENHLRAGITEFAEKCIMERAA